MAFIEGELKRREYHHPEHGPGAMSCSEVILYLTNDKRGPRVVLPVGTYSNYASIGWVGSLFVNPDADDLIEASFFHDPLVYEFHQRIGVRIGDEPERFVSWMEAAKIFRIVHHIKQRKTREGLPYFKHRWFAFWDFIVRWFFWSLISLYGLVR